MRCCRKSLKLRAVGAGLGLTLLSALLFSGCGGAGGLAVSITPGNNQAVDQAQSVSFTAFVPGDSSNSGVTWSLSGSRCKGPACGTFTNSTPFAATYVAPKSVPTGNLLTVTLTATSVAQNSAYATLNIVVSPAPVIATTSLPGVLNGSDYNEQIVANGGVAPLVFTIAPSPPAGCTTSGLPPGLNLNTTGFVTGRTTSDGGAYCFTVTVTDQGSPPLTTSEAYTIVVNPAPALSVATSALSGAALGSTYNFGLAALGGVPPLTWAVTSGTLPPGLSLAGMTGQISGTPTTEGTFPFTVQVTDSSLLPPNQHPQTATQALSLTVGPPKPLSIVTSSLPQADTASLYSQTIITAGGVGPFSWSITSGILPSGISLNPSTGTISGTATAVSSNTFTLQVSDSETPPATQSATFTLAVIAATDNDELLSGNYVFLFNGYNENGPVVLGGNISANGAGSVSGALDSNNNDPLGTTYNNGPGPTQGNTLSGSYEIGSDGRGTLTITLNSIVSVYSFALDAAGDAQLIETDNNSPPTHGTGVLRKQPTPLPVFSPASFSGNYAFQFAGIDVNNKRATYVGVLHADGTAVFSNGSLDSNDAGTLGTNISGATGTFLIAQNGRGEATVSIPGGATLNFLFYMITPSDVLFMGFDGLSSNPMTTGEAILQTQSSFSGASLSGSSVVTLTGENSSGKSSVLLGLLSGNGSSAISGTVHGNDGGSISATNVSGSYNVASNGRVTTSGLGNQLAVMYLVSSNYGFVIGQDSEASSGLAEAQAAGPFTAASFTSYFSLGPPLTGSPVTGGGSANAFAGSLVSTGGSNGTLSFSGKVGESFLAENLAMQGVYTVSSNGAGTFSLSSPSQMPSQLVFYLLSPTALRAISSVSSDSEPSLFFLNH